MRLYFKFDACILSQMRLTLHHYQSNITNIVNLIDNDKTVINKI